MDKVIGTVGAQDKQDKLKRVEDGERRKGGKTKSRGVEERATVADPPRYCDGNGKLPSPWLWASLRFLYTSKVCCL